MTCHESLMIGLGMVGRAGFAFVVMDIAYVQNQIMHKEAFFRHCQVNVYFVLLEAKNVCSITNNQ